MKTPLHLFPFLSAAALVANIAVAEIPAPPDVAAAPADAEFSISGLASKRLTAGNGDRHPGPDDTVTVHYSGWTTDGKMFDSSVERRAPASFPLARVIPGWTEGLQLMVVGEKRRFWIPEALAYRGRAGKPVGMLVFDVELLELEAPPASPPRAGTSPAEAPPIRGGSSDSCIEAVRMFVADASQKGIKIARDVVAKAARSCESGDTRQAINILRAALGPSSPSRGGASESCIRAVRDFVSNTSQKGVEIARAVVVEAEKSCENGDTKQAIGILLAAPPPPTPARIVSFIASKKRISSGDRVALSWQTANTSSVVLEALTTEGTSAAEPRVTLEASGSRMVAPRRTTDYVLLAYGTAQEPTRQKLRIQVDVLEPKILTFTADPVNLRKGGTATLRWDVYGAEQVRLDDADVAISGTRSVAPRSTTTYRLRAWAGEKKAEELVAVHASPFPQPKLSPAFKSVEICGEIDQSGANARCVGTDGLFKSEDEVHLIVRFKNLSKGQHTLERILYAGVEHGSEWKKVHSESGGFSSPRGGYAEATLQIANKVSGLTKLELVLDGGQNTRAEIIYCADRCRGYDEW